MYHGIYFVWGLLPFCFLCLYVWAIMKPWFRVPGRENPRQYFSQFLYTAICLALTIVFDQYYLESVFDTLFAGMFDISIARFLLYPFFLLLGAALPSGPKERKPTRQERFSW